MVYLVVFIFFFNDTPPFFCLKIRKYIFGLKPGSNLDLIRWLKPAATESKDKWGNEASGYGKQG
jgi:hypothetical protein